MERSFRIQIGDAVYEVPQHTTYRQLVDAYADGSPYPVVLVRLDGDTEELFKEVTRDGVLTFVTAQSKEGMAAYRRTGLVVMQKAFSDLVRDPSQTIRVLFTMDQAYYCEVFADDVQVPVSEVFCADLQARMEEIAAQNLPITKCNTSIREADAAFAAHGLKDRRRLFRYRTSTRVNLYALGGYTTYLYGRSMDRTGLLEEFEVLPQAPEGGFFLNFPSMYEPEAVDEFTFQPKLFALQHQDSVRAAMLDLATVGALNDRIADGSMRDAVLSEEAQMELRIGALCDRITRAPDKKFVLIAGPSSSGKTTFSHRLSIQMLSRGLKPHPIAMDDFFIDRDRMVRQPDGSLDFESIDAVDVKLFNETMLRLLDGETVEMPTFDFREGRQKFTGKTLTMQEGDILVIEGIHGLNPLLSASLPEESKFRIYISALSPLKMDEHTCLSTRDMRLMRRIVRDARTRGSSAARTLGMWDSVRRGEEQHIFPFQENADVMFNSSLIYELPVLKQYVEPALFAIPKEDPSYPEARRLLKILSHSLTYPSEGIAAHSILREFIGGSCFNV